MTGKLIFTERQKKYLIMIRDGREIKHYINKKGRKCFDSGEDGCPTLYITLSMRSLLDKKAISCAKNGVCKITKIGLSAISKDINKNAGGGES